MNQFEHLTLKEALAKKEELEALQLRYSNLQKSKKTMLVSLFGAQANAYFSHFDFDNAEAITLTGQSFIKRVGNETNKYLMKAFDLSKTTLVYTDTDSAMFGLEELLEKTGALEKSTEKIVDIIDIFFKKKINPKVAEIAKEFTSEYNTRIHTMTVKREKIAETGVWTGKKKYALLCHDVEGVRYAKPEILVTGLETKRSSSPKVARDYLKDALKLILTKDELSVQEFFRKVEKEFLEKSLEEIAIPMGVNNIEEYYDSKTLFKSRTPMQVKASLYHNEMVKKLKLTEKYEFIASGNKIKMLHLVKPNPAFCDVIAFQGKLPKEFGLDNYVDRHAQFDKAFREPLKRIMTACGWQVEKINYALDDLF